MDSEMFCILLTRVGAKKEVRKLTAGWGGGGGGGGLKCRRSTFSNRCRLTGHSLRSYVCLGPSLP